MRNDVYEEHKLDGEHPKSEVTSLTGSTTTNDTVTMVSGMSGANSVTVRSHSVLTPDSLQKCT